MRRLMTLIFIELCALLLFSCTPEKKSSDVTPPSPPAETIQAEEATTTDVEPASLSREEKLEKAQREEMTE